VLKELEYIKPNKKISKLISNTNIPRAGGPGA